VATKPLTSLRIHDYPNLPITKPPLTGDIDVYSQDGKLYAVTKDALREIAYEPCVHRILVHQPHHRFHVEDVIRQNYLPNTYKKALADTDDNAEAVGMVDEVVDRDWFYLLMNGEYIAKTVPNVEEGTVLWLSKTVPGLLTTTNLTGYGEISKPIAIVTHRRHRMLVVQYRSIEIVEDPGFLGWSGYSGYSGANGIEIPFDIDGGFAASDYWIFDINGGGALALYGAIESIDGGHLL
jgi:hypothetical protein